VSAPLRVIAKLGAIALAFVVLADSAGAVSFFRSVKEPMIVKECGACHMVYPPALLPARSWAKIIGDLGNHFGDDATLPAASLAAVLEYYTKNAGDMGKGSGRFMGRLKASVTPPRITKMPFWLGIHGRFSPASFTQPKVKKIGNCLGCHG
jgi:hypothetical protein